MLYLKNNELEIEIIDPSIDQKLLGSRYCTGGYIFQIKDNKNRNLLSGPQITNPAFDVFDGQGAPEVFTTILNKYAEVGQEVLVPGVGIVEKTSAKSPFHVRDNPLVKKFCKWEIEENYNSIIMKTLQQFKKWQLIINREVTLIGKTIRSKNTVENKSQAPLFIRWFAHPFFPLPINSIACAFSMPFELSKNDGYFINNHGFIEMRPEYNWEKGLFQKIVCNQHKEFSAIQCHPTLGMVSITSDFIPASLAIWANDKTFSFEPFYETQIEVNGKRTWSIGYCF